MRRGSQLCEKTVWVNGPTGKLSSFVKRWWKTAVSLSQLSWHMLLASNSERWYVLYLQLNTKHSIVWIIFIIRIFSFQQQQKPWAGQRRGWGWCFPVTTQPGLASAGSCSGACRPLHCHGNGDGSWPRIHGWGTRRGGEARRRPRPPLGPEGQEVAEEGVILNYHHRVWRHSVWVRKRRTEEKLWWGWTLGYQTEAQQSRKIINRIKRKEEKEAGERNHWDTLIKQLLVFCLAFSGSICCKVVVCATCRWPTQT